MTSLICPLEKDVTPASSEEAKRLMESVSTEMFLAQNRCTDAICSRSITQNGRGPSGAFAPWPQAEAWNGIPSVQLDHSVGPNLEQLVLCRPDDRDSSTYAQFMMITEMTGVEGL